MTVPEGLPIVLGAGPAGAAAALFLARAGQPVRVLDRARFPRDKVCGDAFSGKVVEVLRKLDPGFYPQWAGEKDLQLPSWGIDFYAPNGRQLRIPFRRDGSTQGLAPGFISTRWDFDAQMVERLRSTPGVHLQEGCPAQALTRIPGGFRVQTPAGSFDTPILLGADGAQGLSARLLPSHRPLRQEAAHHSAAIRAYYSGVVGLDPQGFIELHFLPMLPSGYFWIFPLPGGRANVGLGLRSDILSRRKLSLRALLPEILALPQFAARFQQARLEGPVLGFGLPLGSRRHPLSDDHIMLLGDAGALIDPFTGEGIGNAMLSGIWAAQTVLTQMPIGRWQRADLQAYDHKVYQRLGSELQLSRRLQQLAPQQWLFNWLVAKAQRSPTLRQTLSCMFEDTQLRGQLTSPGFYWKLLWE